PDRRARILRGQVAAADLGYRRVPHLPAGARYAVPVGAPMLPAGHGTEPGGGVRDPLSAARVRRRGPLVLSVLDVQPARCERTPDGGDAKLLRPLRLRPVRSPFG